MGKPIGALMVLLTVLFVGLKLGEVGQVAAWSWLWVLSPMWIPFAIWFSVVLGILLLALVIYLLFGERARKVLR